MAAQAPTWEEFNPPYTKTMHRKVYQAIDPKNPANSAKGKVIVVTGGGTGIGKATAAAYIEAGAKAVTILGRRKQVVEDTKAELEKLGSAKVLAVAADLVDGASVEAAFKATEDAFGKVDVVVQNAGAAGEMASIKDADADKWWSVYEINVKGVFLSFRAFLNHKSNNSPTFISVNTGAAHLGFFPSISAYATSKLASAHLITFMQAENPDVRCVSMHPGVLATDMYRESGMNLPEDEMSLPASFNVWLSSPGAAFIAGRFLWAHWDVEELAKMQADIEKNDELHMGLKGWPKV